MKRTLNYIIIVCAISGLCAGCASTNQQAPGSNSSSLGQAPSSNSSSVGSIIIFNPQKVSLKQVAFESSKILTSFAYKANSRPLTELTFGAGGTVSSSPADDNRAISIVTDFQNPTKGSGSKEWRYNVSIRVSSSNSGFLSLLAEVKQPGVLLGQPTDTVVDPFFTPADMGKINAALKNRLQELDPK